MNLVGERKKRPAEQYPISVTYADELAVGETITSFQVFAFNEQSVLDATATICNGSPAQVNGIVTQSIHGGAIGDVYLVLFVVDTSNGKHFEDLVRLSIVFY